MTLNEAIKKAIKKAIDEWWDSWHRYAEEEDEAPDYIKRLVKELENDWGIVFSYDSGKWSGAADGMKSVN